MYFQNLATTVSIERGKLCWRETLIATLLSKFQGSFVKSKLEARMIATRQPVYLHGGEKGLV
jgi:hypothetical protein